MSIESAKSAKDSVSKGSISNMFIGIASFLSILILNDVRTDLKEIKANQAEYMANQKMLIYRVEQLEKVQGITTEKKPTSLLYKHEPIFELIIPTNHEKS